MDRELPQRIVGSKRDLSLWLHDSLECGDTPGLFWLDKRRAVFQIPWEKVRKSKSGLGSQLVSIARDWVIHNGEYDPKRDSPDPVSWKSSLISALYEQRTKGVILKIDADETSEVMTLQFNRRLPGKGVDLKCQDGEAVVGDVCVGVHVGRPS